MFARLRVVGGLSLEAELGGAAIAATDDGTDSGCVECGRSPRLPGKLAAATARFDLISRGAARPHILVGGGVESYATINTDFVYGKREIGVGLDIRLTDGLHLGADVRTGSRELIGSHQSKDVAILLYTPPPLSEEATGYVAGRLTLAASF